MPEYVIHRLMESNHSYNSKTAYRNYLIYDLVHKTLAATGDYIIEDSEGNFVGFAADIDQAKSMIDKLILSNKSDSKDYDSKDLLTIQKTTKPYFIYKTYKNSDPNNPHYGRISPTFYWNEEKNDYLTRLAAATFYRTEDEAKKAMSRRKTSPSLQKYYYYVGNLADSNRKWERKYLAGK